MYGIHSFYFLFLIFYIFYGLLIRIITKREGKRLHYLIFLFLPLLLLSALRGETVGGDLEKYIPEFYEVCRIRSFSDLMSFSSHEPGFIILLRLIGYISSNYHFLLFITSLLSLAGPFILIYRYSKNELASVLIYYSLGYYTNTFNNIRQSIAISIFFISIYFLLNKKTLKYYLLTFLAISFHYSAIVLLVIYPLVRNELSIKKVVFTLGICVLTYLIAGSSIIYNIVTLLFVKYDPDLIFERVGAGWHLLIFYCFLFLIFFYIYKGRGKLLNGPSRGLLSTLLTIQLFAICFQLFATLYPSATRMGQYFFIPIIITIPLLSSLLKNEVIKLSFILLIFVYCITSTIRVYSYDDITGSNSQGVIPYVLYDEVIR